MDENEELARYLEGDMNVQEMASFEKRFESDSNLKERVFLHQRMDIALGNQEEVSLESSLRAMMDRMGEVEEPEEEEVPKRFNPRLWWGVAASVLLLAVVGISLYASSSSQSGQELFAEHYQAYDASNELRTADSIPKRLLDDAFDAYNAADFSNALLAFNEILSVDANHVRARFYAGICQLELQDYAKARSSFTYVIQDQKNLYINQSSWYLGLVCLSVGDLECVNQQLGPISKQPTGRYRKGAADILEAWEKL